MDALQAALNELHTFPLFSGYTRDELMYLCEGGRIQVTEHRDQLFSAGDPALSFGVVIYGAYKLCRPSPMGEDVIMHFSTPGDVVAAFIMGQPHPIYPISAVSMGNSRYLKIPQQNYLERWTKKPELILRIQSLLFQRMTILQDQKAFTKAPLNQKVAALLMQLLDRNTREEGMFLPLPLTRKEIADSLGASVESVIRVMSDWSKQGYIQTTGQQIEVCRPDKLIEILKIE